jgi:hypothetical protein
LRQPFVHRQAAGSAYLSGERLLLFFLQVPTASVVVSRLLHCSKSLVKKDRTPLINLGRGKGTPMRWLARYFELSRSSAGHNLRPMEGLRGFAVFLVFLVHYSKLVMQTITEGSGLDRLLHQVHALGNTGVGLFFVLSGYLAWSLSYRILYYIVLPIVIGLFGIKRRSKQWRVIFFSVIAISILLYCFTNGGRVRLAMFLSGILLYEALLDKTAPAPRSGLAFLILIGGCLLRSRGFKERPVTQSRWQYSFPPFLWFVMPVLISRIRGSLVVLDGRRCDRLET